MCGGERVKRETRNRDISGVVLPTFLSVRIRAFLSCMTCLKLTKID